jgi:hypothetical protein
VIRKRDGEFVVLDRTGKKVLGRHKTEAAAKAQLAAIEIRKHR